jgi:hypothetical protein
VCACGPRLCMLWGGACPHDGVWKKDGSMGERAKCAERPCMWPAAETAEAGAVKAKVPEGCPRKPWGCAPTGPLWLLLARLPEPSRSLACWLPGWMTYACMAAAGTAGGAVDVDEEADAAERALCAVEARISGERAPPCAGGGCCGGGPCSLNGDRAGGRLMGRTGCSGGSGGASGAEGGVGERPNRGLQCKRACMSEREKKRGE